MIKRLNKTIEKTIQIDQISNDFRRCGYLQW
jgi:hypothetical protein